jgi:hypothetical protein
MSFHIRTRRLVHHPSVGLAGSATRDRVTEYRRPRPASITRGPTRAPGTPAAAEPPAAALSRTVAKAFTVVDVLAAQSDRGITLSDLSAQLHMPKSTVHRYLATLQQQGCERSDTDRFRLGARSSSSQHVPGQQRPENGEPGRPRNVSTRRMRRSTWPSLRGRRWSISPRWRASTLCVCIRTSERVCRCTAPPWGRRSWPSAPRSAAGTSWRSR